MDGFTVVRCAACAQVFYPPRRLRRPPSPVPSGFDGGAAALPGVDEVLVEGLRAVVRDSRHGVLVSGGCPLGPGCGTREPGMVLLVQPCDADRAPLGPVVVAGPVRSTDDVRAVTGWLARGDLDPDGLPARLRGPRRLTPRSG
ncbi:MAG: hypothetical protein M3235_22190 [Actinomycetota bacterium]|nr:hypothetical protein [Actinomycetota bacterium]